jgi:hypothetical protein
MAWNKPLAAVLAESLSLPVGKGGDGYWRQDLDPAITA